MSAAVGLFCAGIAFPQSADSDSLAATDILNRIDDLFRGKSSQGIMSMTVVTKHWERTLKLEFWSEGTEKSLLRILSPKKERGAATLKSGNDLWNYLPKVKRVIKLPSSMLSASWMGSHYSNDDLVKESRFTDEYDFILSGYGEIHSARTIEVTCTPKEDAVVVWGKVTVIVYEESLQPVEIRYFDESLEIARTLYFSEIKTLGGREIPARMDMIPADKPDERTTIVYEEILFDLELPADMFTLRNLQR